MFLYKLWKYLFQFCEKHVGSLIGISLNPQIVWVQFSSVQSLSHVQLFMIPWTAACHASLSFTNSWSCSNSCPSNLWCYPTISSSVVSISSHPQSFPASESFPMSQFFASSGQSIRVSASGSVFPINIQDWFPLGLTDFISLLSKGLSKVFSGTTIKKHQFFDAQPFLCHVHICTWLLEKL